MNYGSILLAMGGLLLQAAAVGSTEPEYVSWFVMMSGLVLMVIQRRVCLNGWHDPAVPVL
jgi:hypothetical protein